MLVCNIAFSRRHFPGLGLGLGLVLGIVLGVVLGIVLYSSLAECGLASRSAG